MTHLYIELNTGLTEEVNSSIISKLYELAISGDLDNTSDLKGRLHTTLGYRSEVEYLNTTFPDLYISVDDYAIPFEDPNMLQYLLDRGIGSNGMITENQAAAVTSVANSANTTVTKFNEFKYFTSITESAGGFSSSADGNFKFYDWDALEEIDISNLTSIGHDNSNGWGDTLVGCDSLKKVTASNKLKKLGYYAFGQCSNLEEITGLSGVIETWDRAFVDCSKLKLSFFQPLLFLLKTFGIGEHFSNCTLLTSITIADGTTSIPKNCFYGCTNLSSVSIPSTVTTVGDVAFQYCTSLTDVDIDWTKITSIGSSAFKLSAITGSLTLSSLTSIDGNYENGAFRGCTGLTSVDLSGSTITSLSGTFRDCTNLSSVTLPDTLTSLESNTFSECSSLQTIDLKNVTYLIEYEFRNSGLTSIDLSNIQHIGGDGVFYGCTNLTTVTFPSTPFDWFDNYNTSFENKRSFLRQCTSLTSVDLSNALSLCISMFYNDTSLTTVTLSASNITNIPDEFCLGCTNLSSLGEKIKPTRIGDRAFLDCNSLNVNTYLDLSEVTYIGHSALKGTTITGSVTLPECLELGESPFHENPGITELHCPKLTTINVYMGWTNFANLEVLDLPVTNRLNNVLNNPKLTTINAPLATKFNTYEDGKLYLGNNPRLSTLNIDFSLVTKIGDWCFDKDAGLNGQYLEFPNVTEIGAQAFGNNAINFVLSNNTMVTYNDYGAPFPGYTGTVYVPDALLSTYRANSIWSLLPSSQMKGLSELPNS